MANRYKNREKTSDDTFLILQTVALQILNL
jgi:hypothetical protein